MRLNLGCGDRHLPGFTNVDFETNWASKKPDVATDLSKPLPFENESADEIHAYHVFEHFYRYDADEILTDWVRVLKPAGRLVLELPCLDKIYLLMKHHIEGGIEMPVNLTLWGLYGNPEYFQPTMVHRWCYSIAELKQMMEDRGLAVKLAQATTHQPVRDMRLEGTK